MIELQLLNKVLNSKSISLLELNGIGKEHFKIYSDEYEYIINHYKEYGNIPDKETFIIRFTDFEFIEVNESDRYLIDTINEDHLYSISVPIINKLAEIMKEDANKAVQFLKSKLPELNTNMMVLGTDIISQAQERLDEWEKLKENKDTHLIPSGFQELDEIIGGFSRGEELVVLFARTGNGKSWVLIKMLEHAWKMNRRVGLIEPEMSANKTGYRFDTLHANFSNWSLTKGNEVEKYVEYINELKSKELPFFVATPKEFKRNITVSKLKTFVETNKLDMLAIDGISYLKDERASRGDSRTISLTNISEDLMDLSIELGIPIIVVAQSNREGAKEELGLENIRDSDGIAYNASLVLAVQQKDPGLDLIVLKNRNGKNNITFTYLWDIDIGKFNYLPSGNENEIDRQASQKLRQKFKDEGNEVF